MCPTLATRRPCFDVLKGGRNSVPQALTVAQPRVQDLVVLEAASETLVGLAVDAESGSWAGLQPRRKWARHPSGSCYRVPDFLMRITRPAHNFRG